jgi:oligopeptide/dipeptide ABC transporter ATP-binding protein
MAEAAPLFDVRGLVTRFETDAGPVVPSDGVSFAISPGEVLGLVGESGSGKSVTARASIRLQQPEKATRAGELFYRGRDLRRLGAADMRAIRAREIAMVVQDPGSALNPVMTVGDQLTRIARQQDASVQEARETALGLLRRMRIAAPENRLDAFPHQLSGGMRQRVLIALALMCRPKLLIADEPTTALDVTVEADILALLDHLRREMGMAMLMISHNLSAIGRLCDRIAVMYAGRLVEEGPTRAVLTEPAHPYTRALLASVPKGSKVDGPLAAVPGEPPDLARLPAGCAFQARCPQAEARCGEPQALRAIAADRSAACWKTAQ